MRLDRLWRSTPFRLATLFSLLFIVAFVASSFVALRAIQAHLIRRLDQDIDNTYAMLAASYGESDLEDLTQAVTTQTAIVQRLHDRVYLLTDGPRGRLAGNVGTAGTKTGWQTVDAGVLGLNGDQHYRVFVGDVSGHQLLVGKSFAEIDDVGETVATAFAWATGLAVLGAVAGATLIALRLQRRMDAIASTMAQVSAGDLTGRIAPGKQTDDIGILTSQINAALDRLSALFEGMKQVSADIAHELKTPLNRLKLTIQEAVAKQERGRGVRAELADAEAESDRINATFDALLRIAQIEAGARRQRFGPVSLRQVVQDIAEVYVDTANDAGMTLLLDAGEDAAEVLGDRDLLLQLYANLVENSLKHCSPGCRIQIALSARPVVAIRITDTGPGIPAEERNKVLRRLYRLEKSRTTPGSGLGLSMVKAIADLHHAVIELSDNCPGLAVTVRFPDSTRSS
jgi:signal transduction histidine kinase